MNKFTVLLAEDDDDDRNIFRDFLNGRTDIALMPFAENGVEAIAALDSIKSDDNLPSFVILDHNMPKLNGKQTLKLLKSIPRYTHIPVFIYSTYADAQLIENCITAGAVMVFSKPFTKDGYHEMIDAFVAAIKEGITT